MLLEKNWDAGKVKGNAEDARMINSYLKQVEAKICRYHNTHLKDTIEWGTLKNYMTTQRYEQEFVNSGYMAADIALHLLSYKFLTDFERFLRSYVPLDHHSKR